MPPAGRRRARRRGHRRADQRRGVGRVRASVNARARCDRRISCRSLPLTSASVVPGPVRHATVDAPRDESRADDRRGQPHVAHPRPARRAGGRRRRRPAAPRGVAPRAARCRRRARHARPHARTHRPHCRRPRHSGRVARRARAEVPVARRGRTTGCWPWSRSGTSSASRPADDELVVVHTPGHSPDHICLWHEASRTLFGGDLLIAGGTVVIPASRGGRLSDYLRSLERVLALDPAVVLPAHGADIERPADLIRGNLAHRRRREAQVLEALVARPAHAGDAGRDDLRSVARPAAAAGGGERARAPRQARRRRPCHRRTAIGTRSCHDAHALTHTLARSCSSRRRSCRLSSRREGPHPLLLDVRAAEEFAAGHLPEAVHLDLWGFSLPDTDDAPLRSFLWMIEHVLALRGVTSDRPVVVYGDDLGRCARPACSGSSSTSGTRTCGCSTAAFRHGSRPGSRSRPR